MTREQHAKKAFDAYCKAVSIKETKDWEFKDLPASNKKAWLAVGKYIVQREREIKRLFGVGGA